MRSCQKCGTEVEKDDTYCPECGIKIKKETKKITILTLFKILGVIILFIIFINLLKGNPFVAIIFLIVFLIWTNMLNKILKKIFNTELSIGVKIIVTVILVVMFIIASQQASKPKVYKEIRPELERQLEERPLEGSQGYEFIGKINKIINSRDYEALEIMFKEGRITQEVFEDISNVLKSRDYVSINLNLKVQNSYGTHAEFIVSAVIRTDFEEREEKTLWIFEQINHEWTLVGIKPRLSELKLSKSFEEQTGSQIKKIQKPIIAVSKNTEISTRNIIKLENSYL